jgi:hypothetical protein
MQRAVLELGGTEVAEREVTTTAVAERFDVLEDRDAGHGLGRPRAAVHEVLLDRGVEALKHHVVEASSPLAPIATSIPPMRQRRVKPGTCTARTQPVLVSVFR